MTNPSDPIDPVAAWRDWMNQSERQWNAFLNEAMATDEFSRSMGRGIDLFLNTQGQMNEAIGRLLISMNLPTRTDVLSIADRLSSIEERLLAIESQLAAIRPAGDDATAARPEPVAVPRPPRTRRPASE